MAFPYKTYEKEMASRTKELRRAYRKGDLFKTICYLRYISSFYYQVNCKFTDDELEELTSSVAHKLLGKTVLTGCNEKTVLFYDNFGLQTRGLANIYINALIKLNFHIVWVLYDFLPDTDKLLKQYADQNNVEFFVIPKQTIIDRMMDLRKVILDKNPRHVFVYTTPDDIAGLGVMSTIKGDVDRYLIDLTDHAFWVGKCAVDWFIGFRNYGYNIAVRYRKIAPEKVMILPYYPDLRKKYPFEGLPFDVENYEFVFSGGSPYKLEGDTTYQEIVRNILNKYPDIKFIYAGNGTNQTLETLKYEFPERFYHIKERKDLDSIFHRAKFYLSTFPIAGGLMAQFAIQNECVPFTLCLDKESMVDIKEMMLKPENADFVLYSKEELLTSIDNLVCDESYCCKMKHGLSGQVISEQDFIQELGRLIYTKKTKFSGTLKNINVDSYIERYKKVYTYNRFCQLIYESKNKWVYRKHPIIVWREKRKRRQNKGNTDFSGFNQK